VRAGSYFVHDQAQFASLLRCPACGGGVPARAGDAWQCPACATRFPEFDGIPWLFAAPEAALAEWRQRLHALLADLGREALGLRAALDRPALAVAARNRLKLQAAALEDHARRLAALLAPIGAEQGTATPEMHRALGTRIPGAQGIASYYVNLHRDWVWGAEENAASLAAVVAALDSPVLRRVLVLGAGAGRLVYDLQQRLRPALVVALDINPLYAFVARRIFDGERVSLYEFPIAPRDAESHAILRTLAAERALGGVEFVLGDASHAPFAPGSFDAVITPWLIDIIDEDLASFAPRVNALLEPGGRWVNTGSLAFAQADPALRYTLEEVVDLVATSGFARPETSEQRIPYMCSPASRHGRVESVVTFCAVKEHDAIATQHATLPPWLVDPRVPVPALQEFQNAALTMRIYGFLASLIDGRRSLADMAQVLVSERLMTAESATPAVRGFVQRLWEESRRRTRF
jgi:hypothetical protein